MSETAPLRRKAWEGTHIATTEDRVVIVLDGDTVPEAHQGRRVYVPITSGMQAAATRKDGKKNKKGKKK